MGADRFGLDTRVPGWPLALFRIAFGILYLDMALQKAPWKNYGWRRGFIEQEIATRPFRWSPAFSRASCSRTSPSSG
jgi:hypothetical protein